jgi:hypothetical protein
MANCNQTLGSFEGAIGWGPETVCGVPRTAAELSPLAPFGIVTSVTPDGWGNARTKRRGIGHQLPSQNRRTSFLGGIGVEYNPIATQLTNALTRVLGGSSWQNHMSTFFIEYGLKRDTATVQDIRWLLNRCKVNTFTMAFALDEPIVFTEAILAQYVQENDSGKGYLELRYDDADPTTKIYDAMTIGADPAAITEAMLMYYESGFILVEDPGGTPTDILLTDVSEASVEFNRNLSPRRGIRKGHPIIYENAENNGVITLNITKDFQNRTEYDRMMANEDFDFKIPIGPTLEVKLTGGNWEESPPTISDEDLVGETLVAEFMDAELI